MRKQVFAAVLFLSLALMPAAHAGRVLDIGLNRAELVSLSTPMNEVMIANPEVADVVVHGSQKISVIGKKIGSTNMRFFDAKSNLIHELDIIVGYDLPAIRRTLKKFYPDVDISVETINNSLAIAGIVPDAQTANRIMQISYEFVKESRKDDVGSGTEGKFTEKDDRFPGIVNLMKLNSSQQVMLRVKIGEMKRSAVKQLGINLQAALKTGSSIFQFATGSGQYGFIRDDEGVAPGIGHFGSQAAGTFGSGASGFRRGNFEVAGWFDALEGDGLFKVLAEPNLTTVSGEAASFLAGGEFPIPQVTSDTAQTTFKQYGVSLSFVPYVLSGNRVRLVVAPELSEIDKSNAVGNIPALTTRKSKTTVELAPGESLMIAGLIRDRVNTAINEMPGIAEIPIISALFRSTDYQREESELVIAVTPYIVDPVVSNNIRMPSDEYRTPSVMEMMFYGALGSMSGNADRISQTPVLEGPIGFMMD